MLEASTIVGASVGDPIVTFVVGPPFFSAITIPKENLSMSMSALTLISLAMLPLSIYTPIAESSSLGLSKLDNKSFAFEYCPFCLSIG